MKKLRKLLRYNLWFEHDLVKIGGVVYLERWFCYLLGFTVRLHKFHRGDDDRAVHDHPWAFITFPFKGYYERVHLNAPGEYRIHFVKPWGFHYRPSSYQHMVLGTHYSEGWKAKGPQPELKAMWLTPKPFFTFVVTGRKDRAWGFWPDGKYVYWRTFQEFMGSPR